MKRLSYILMAFTMLLGLAQCKKDQPQSGEKVYITVKVNNGASTGSATDGAKADVDPADGKITFSNGDKLYVGYNGAKVDGELTYSTATSSFSGDLTISKSGDQKLYFYFLGGNLTPTIAGSTYTVDISDQTGSTKPIISSGASEENYNGTGTYHVTLLNQCALVKVTVSGDVTATPTEIVVDYSSVTVDFSSNTVTPVAGEGKIKLAAGTGDRWAIVLPQGAHAAESRKVEGTNVINVTQPAMAAVAANGSGVYAVTVTDLYFTVSAGGDKVYFSKGNLQYIGSAATPYWKFADHQWETWSRNYEHAQFSDATNVDRDLFGWGTSGYNHGATCYQPWSTSTTPGDYNAYNNSTSNLYNSSGQADWGYNPISNGGNIENSWRTPTYSEWYYLIPATYDPHLCRPDAEKKIGYAHVGDILGTVLLPDNWTLPSGLTFNTGTCYTDSGSPLYYIAPNSYTTEQWNLMEANGAVFLPIVYYSRSGTNTYGLEICEYWSSSYYETYNNCAYIFYGSPSTPQGWNYENKKLGISVRLVRNR